MITHWYMDCKKFLNGDLTIKECSIEYFYRNTCMTCAKIALKNINFQEDFIGEVKKNIKSLTYNQSFEKLLSEEK